MSNVKSLWVYDNYENEDIAYSLFSKEHLLTYELQDKRMGVLRFQIVP